MGMSTSVVICGPCYRKTNRKTILQQKRQLLIDLRHRHASSAQRDPSPDFSETQCLDTMGRRLLKLHKSSFIKTLQFLWLSILLNVLPSLKGFLKSQSSLEIFSVWWRQSDKTHSYLSPGDQGQALGCWLYHQPRGVRRAAAHSWASALSPVV